MVSGQRFDPTVGRHEKDVMEVDEVPHGPRSDHEHCSGEEHRQNPKIPDRPVRTEQAKEREQVDEASPVEDQ